MGGEGRRGEGRGGQGRGGTGRRGEATWPLPRVLCLAQQGAQGGGALEGVAEPEAVGSSKRVSALRVARSDRAGMCPGALGASQWAGEAWGVRESVASAELASPPWKARVGARPWEEGSARPPLPGAGPPQPRLRSTGPWGRNPREAVAKLEMRPRVKWHCSQRGRCLQGPSWEVYVWRSERSGRRRGRSLPASQARERPPVLAASREQQS
jgi:hypothetical protein